MPRFLRPGRRAANRPIFLSRWARLRARLRQDPPDFFDHVIGIVSALGLVFCISWLVFERFFAQ